MTILDARMSADDLEVAIAAQGQLLKEHDRVIERVLEEQRSLRELMMSNQSILAGLTTAVNGIQKDLARLNGSTTKLIFVLVGALIMLAGVTKLTGLGIL